MAQTSLLLLDEPYMKAVVLDIEEDIVDLLDYNLTNAGFDVLGLDNEDDMVSMVATYHPRLLLVGNCSSLNKQQEICSRIRQIALAWAQQPLIIGLTTEDDQETQAKLLEYGADMCLVTPILPRVLLTHIRHNLRSEFVLGSS